MVSMSAVSVFRHRFFIIAPFLLGSVLLHLLVAVWGVWNVVQPEPESAPLESQAVSIGLINHAPAKKTQAKPAPVPVKVAESKSAALSAPYQEPVNPAPEQPSPSEPEASTETAAIPAQDLTPNSLSPEVLSESVLSEVVTQPMDPAEFIITRSPASAYLHYEVSLRRGSERLNGSGNLQWEWQQDRYRIEITARVIVQVSKQVSAGVWQLNAGLVPQIYSDQRGLRSENRVEFERQTLPPQLYFSATHHRLALVPGVQDYASLIMQLSSLLASNPSNFYIGTAVRFPVADARRSREMIFQLQEPEMLDTGLGRLQAWRFSYQPGAASSDRSIDIWFAPDADWLPVRLRFADAGRGEVIEFTVRRRETL
jgi:hypothetical protein